MDILSSFAYPHVVPSLYDLFIYLECHIDRMVLFTELFYFILFLVNRK